MSRTGRAGIVCDSFGKTPSLVGCERRSEAVGVCSAVPDSRTIRQDGPVTVREQQAADYDAIRHVYAEAFRRPRFRQAQSPGSVPPEVGLFEALWEAGDVIFELSFTAITDGGVAGHVTASRATVATDPVVAIGPIGVLPEQQGSGIGSSLMEALLGASEAADVPFGRSARRAGVLRPLRIPAGHGAGRAVSGAGMGRCLSSPTSDGVQGIDRRTVSVRAGLLAVVAQASAVTGRAARRALLQE